MKHNKKELVASIFDVLKISDLMFMLLNKRTHNNYIRVINYHELNDRDVNLFEGHLKFYKKHFANCNKSTLDEFISGERKFIEKPGIILSFDDGFQDNYDNALPLLEKYGFTGWFMISSRNINDKYMTNDEIIDLNKRNHIIGCHTATHHRMNMEDSDKVLEDEIINAKDELEKLVGEVEIFCWVGGEEGTYTTKAYEYICKSGYKYVFMTNSFPLLPLANPHHIERTNVQAYWNLSTVKFQVSGLIDMKYRCKRMKEERITSFEQ